jgi:hypothetical protein
MTRIGDYRAHLQSLDPSSWDDYLVTESALPGPRANLELAQAAADTGEEAQFSRWLELGPDQAPQDSARLFLPICGAIGLGRLIAEGRRDLLPRLRASARDPRWRVREGVVLGLQRLGDRDVPGLIRTMREWMHGGLLEQRAVVAILCEPRLLRDTSAAASVLELLDHATETVHRSASRRDPDLRVLRQTLGYGWSVLISALPSQGKPAFERWATVKDDPDVQWIVRENLKKARLRRIDATWVEALAATVASSNT